MGTKKYTLAKLVTGAMIVGGSLLALSSHNDQNWLERNAKTKGWRSERGYTVVDYDYYKKEKGIASKNGLSLLALMGAAARAIYYFKK